MEKNRIATVDTSLTTMQVTIHVISVNNKKMTLAVFRQLPNKNFFDENLNIIGNIWGFVKYKIGAHYRWVVFDREGLLFRSPFPSKKDIRSDQRTLKFNNEQIQFKKDEYRRYPTISTIKERISLLEKENGLIQKRIDSDAKYNKKIDKIETEIIKHPQLFIAI